MNISHKCPIVSCKCFFFIYVILAYVSSSICSRPVPSSCGLYGAPPCQYLPAPPGQTPTCARPGKTYCEHVDNYPTYLIKHLVQKWGYEARNLLIDETWEDFAAVAWHETPVFYDPKSIFPNRDFSNPHSSDFNGYNYQTPGFDNVGNSVPTNSLFITNPKQTTDSPTSYLLYTSSASQRVNYNKQAAAGVGPVRSYYNHYSNNGRTTPYNATLWLKRLARDLSQRKVYSALSKQQREEQVKEVTLKTEHEADIVEKSIEEKRNTRDVSINMDLLDIVGLEHNQKLTGGKGTRVKRQSAGRTALCQTTSQFITPQAALNSRGNWMFVVNEANTARQMVKAELCASNTCSNLCDLPNGYNSRCEQKFVQKRLIALQGNGQNLYTDTFWFPSCCVCTIAAN